MSLLRKLERRDYMGGAFTDPNIIPTNGSLSYYAGGHHISDERAMRHWAVWACVRIVADVVSTLPIDVYTGDTQPVEPLPSKITNPSVYASSLQWRWQTIASLMLRGNTYGLIAMSDRLGYPSQVDLLPPELVTPKLNDRTGKKEFQVRDRSGVRILSTDQLWHLPGPQLPGQLEGMSPIAYAAATIGVGLDSEQFSSDFYRNRINPAAVATTDQKIDELQAAEIKRRIKKAVANHDLAVLGAGMKLDAWAGRMTASDAQFLETSRANALAVSQIFGVPPEMIGVASSGSSVTYANREQRAQDFLNNAVNPWLARLEEALSAWFPRGTYVKFNTGALLRSDLLTRYQADQIGIRNGFLRKSEVRDLEDLPPIPGIDDEPLPGAVTNPVQGAPNG